MTLWQLLIISLKNNTKKIDFLNIHMKDSGMIRDFLFQSIGIQQSIQPVL